MVSGLFSFQFLPPHQERSPSGFGARVFSGVVGSEIDKFAYPAYISWKIGER
jgi:hypothetical protein